jgi:glycosyltransferase involved in cell wall biosynthesis
MDSIDRISIVTPSFNQGKYLKICMSSVLAQAVPGLEYILMDGGSTDGSIEIIRQFADRLAYWQSQPDGGHMDALNAGFARSTGEIMGWLNSDDMLMPWALSVVQSVFARFPQVEWLTTRFPMVMNPEGTILNARQMEGFHAKLFYRGRNVAIHPRFYAGVIQQESTFWRRSLWERAGGKVDASLRIAGDFELWSRFFQFAELYAVSVPLGCFRFQSESLTAKEMNLYLSVCKSILSRFSYSSPALPEILIRRLAHTLPRKFQRWTGLAVSVPIVAQSGRVGEWEIRREWIL